MRRCQVRNIWQLWCRAVNRVARFGQCDDARDRRICRAADDVPDNMRKSHSSRQLRTPELRKCALLMHWITSRYPVLSAVPLAGSAILATSARARWYRSVMDRAISSASAASIRPRSPSPAPATSAPSLARAVLDDVAAERSVIVDETAECRSCVAFGELGGEHSGGVLGTRRVACTCRTPRQRPNRCVGTAQRDTATS
jgi:hypothetical protein